MALFEVMKLVCCFFGHKDTPESVTKPLEATIRKLIEQEGIDCFLVGHQGSFDRMTLSILRKLGAEYPHVSYHIVLAYMPGRKEGCSLDNPMETLLPEGLELIHPRYAISWRNKWMIDASDIVVTYITHSWGGATQFAELAKKKGKRVFNIKDACG